MSIVGSMSNSVLISLQCTGEGAPFESGGEGGSEQNSCLMVMKLPLFCGTFRL